ncbi:MAG: outer membrane beta-barrel protein [Prevotellaceae bacterium]|jgi:hypothetical protein|nr:outer membrane beta-barrel protein [Prevotellaceae bacterium]
MSNDKLKDLFHEKLYNHESEIFESDWEIIRERIQKKRQRKIIPLFYFYGTTGIAVALLLVMFLIKPDNIDIPDITISQTDIKKGKSDTITENNSNNHIANIEQNTQTNKPVSENTDNNVKIAYNSNNDKNNELIQTKSDESINRSVDKIEKIDYNKFTLNFIDILTDKSVNEVERTIAKVAITKQTESSYSTDKQKSIEENKQEIKQINTNDEWWNQFETETPKEQNKNTWTFAFESGNSIGSNSIVRDFANKNSHNAQSSIADMPIMSATPTVSPESLKTDDKIDMKHKHPLNFGIRIKKNINKNIIAKTGFSYSYFLSEFSTEGKKIQQKIHYVGIPVGFEFLFFKKNNFNIYLTGEFAAEKGVSYSYIKAVQEISESKYYTIENRSVRGIQFSTNAGLGVSYNFIKNMGIYIEPNVVYYIKDNNQPQSFRTEKQFNLGLNIGLKYDF